MESNTNSTQSNKDRRILAILSLSLLIAGVPGSIFLSAFDDDIAGLFGVTSIILALIFGIIARKEKLARITVFISLGIFILSLILALFFLFSGNEDKNDYFEMQQGSKAKQVD